MAQSGQAHFHVSFYLDIYQTRKRMFAIARDSSKLSEPKRKEEAHCVRAMLSDFCRNTVESGGKC